MSEVMEKVAEFRNNGREFKNEIAEAYDEKISALIGELRAQRKEMGISQQDVADATGMKAPNVNRIETRKVIPSLEVLMRYAAALGYDVEITLKKN